MTDSVKVPYEKGKRSDQATLLLGAAEELGLDASVVRMTRQGFEVPAEVEEKVSGGSKKERTAKRATAKKTAATSEKAEDDNA